MELLGFESQIGLGTGAPIDGGATRRQLVDGRIVIRPLRRPPRATVERVATAGIGIGQLPVVVQLEVQVRPGRIAGTADQPQVFARHHRVADSLRRQRIALQVAVPGHRAVGVAHVDGVPRIAVETATLVGVALAPAGDDPIGGGHDGHVPGGHLVPGERPQVKVGALVVIAGGGVIGATAAGVIEQLVGVGRIVIHEAGDGVVAGVSQPRARGQRPAQGHARGGGRGQPPLGRQPGDVGPQHGLNRRSLGVAQRVGWRRVLPAAKRLQLRSQWLRRDRPGQPNQRQQRALQQQERRSPAQTARIARFPVHRRMILTH